LSDDLQLNADLQLKNAQNQVDPFWVNGCKRVAKDTIRDRLFIQDETPWASMRPEIDLSKYIPIR